MASRTAAPSAVLLLRLVTLALLAASFAIIAADKFTDDSFPGVPPQKYCTPSRTSTHTGN
jgi:hypothetical protein